MTTLPDSLPGLLFGWAQQRPHDVALREKNLGVWREISWSEYRDHTAAAARAMIEAGVGPGDHVAILSENRPEWLYADLAAQSIGARSVGIYQTNPPADVAYILQHSRCKILFCEDQEQVDKAIEVAAETPSVTKVVIFDPRGTKSYRDARLEPWDSFAERGRTLLVDGWFEAQLRKLDPHAAAMVVYTSGTTGQPKGAMLSANNVIAVGRSIVARHRAELKDSTLSYLPLCHVAEKIFTLFQPLLCGSVVHFGESIETVREDLREVSPTIFLGVPRIWEKMYAGVTLRMKDSSRLKRVLFDYFVQRGRASSARRRKGMMSFADKLWWRLGDIFVYRPLQERLGLRRCRLAVSGAAPIAPELLEWFWSVGVPIHEGYGQTESGGVTHTNPLGDPRLGTVGQLLPVLEEKLDDDGELLVRGSCVFLGYLHDPEATARTIDPDGWLHTGDIGAIDADGFLTITGRKKEIIITAGGKNLSPERIENALKMSPYIKEAVAIGDRRSFVSALVQIDGEATGDWATRRAIPYTSFEDLSQRPEVHQLISEEIDKINERLARVEHVRAFRLLPKELHQDDGELTATQKVRRRAVCQSYAAVIEQMYGAPAR